jgi:hypothetical protein
MLISHWSSVADNFRAAKPAVDFPRPGGRRAQRAYFDAVRDLVAPSFGWTVCRVPAPECNAVTAAARLRATRPTSTALNCWGRQGPELPPLFVSRPRLLSLATPPHSRMPVGSVAASSRRIALNGAGRNSRAGTA